MIEVKDAAKSFTLKADYLGRLHDVAARAGKTARMVVRFPGLEVDITVRRTSVRRT